MVMRRRVFTLIIAGLVAVTACTGPPNETPTSTPTAEQSVDVQIPDTPVGTAATWVLETLEADSGPTAEEAEKHFAQIFLNEVPATQVGAVFDQIRGLRPIEVVHWNGDDTSAVARLSTTNGEMDMRISVDADQLINGLFFAPSEAPPTVGSAAEANQALANRAQQSSFLLADGECTTIEARDTDVVLPIGSMFKLYVLGAVVDAIADGTLSWDTELTITEELKSLPSGVLQEEPAGTTVTVRKAAGLMLSISDNTATDLLIDAVGREAVEAQLEPMGNSNPELMKPFLTTREMFQVALSDPELRKKWAATTPSATDASPEVTAAQRAVLDELPAWDRTLDDTLGTAPFWPDGLDWFASAEDLCRAHVALQEVAKTEAGAPVREILSENPGVEVEGASYVGFKGGSSLGEIGLSFYVEGTETRVLVLQSAADTAQGVPSENWMAELARQVLSTP